MRNADFRRVASRYLLAALCLVPVSSSAWAKSSKDNIKVGILAFTYNSPAIQVITDTAMAECKVRGWTCEIFDAKNDAVALSNAGTNFINRKFDAILNSVSNNNELGAVIKAANAANIPFVSMYGGLVPGITADIAASGVVQGALLGSEVRAAIGLEGKVVLVNRLVLPVSRERTRGFKAALADDKNIKLMEIEVRVPGHVEDSYNQITAMLQGNKDVKAIMIGWNELAPGAVRAVEQAGMSKQIKLYGYDMVTEATELMRKEGSPLVMTVGLSNEETGRKGISVLADAIDGKPIPTKAVMMRSCLFTKDNLPPPGKEPDYAHCTPFTGEMTSK